MTVDVSQYIDADRGLIRGEIFTSREIYERELEQVFARSWLFLAHDSMIPKPGDFIQNYMGEDPVVVARQRDGSVKAFMNQCRHRGMRICRADRGNAKNFMCSFHGWTYDIAGNLIHVPHEEDIYDPKVFDKKDWGPIQVPRITNYKGFIFGTWDTTAPSFEEYLGDMAWYFDAYIDRYEGGLEAIAQHKWVIPCNWKFNAEQPSSDMYHAEVSHASAVQVLKRPGADNGAERYATGRGHQFSSPFGHGAGWFDTTESSSRNPVIAAWENETQAQVAERLGEVRAAAVRGHANIFPTFMLLNNGSLRVTHPRGPHEMEVWSWTFVPVMAPPEVKEQYRIEVLRTFSPGGMFEQDDAENWLEEQRIMRGYMARKHPLVYTMHLGNARKDVDGFPGTTVPHCYADEGARGMYRHYQDLMSGAPWPELIERKKRREEEAANR